MIVVGEFKVDIRHDKKEQRNKIETKIRRTKKNFWYDVEDQDEEQEFIKYLLALEKKKNDLSMGYYPHYNPQYDSSTEKFLESIEIFLYVHEVSNFILYFQLYACFVSVLY